MQLITLTETELSMLSGQPYILTALYIYLRKYMDFATGITGRVRGISYQSISEALYIEPERGIKSGSPHKSTIRRAIDRLEKIGMIRRGKNPDLLVFKLVFAHTEQLKPKKADTKPTHQADTPKPAPIQAPEKQADTPKKREADIPKESGNYINKLPPPNNDPLYAGGVVEDLKLIFPQGLSHDQKTQIKKLMSGLSLDIQQDIIDELSGGIGYEQIKNPIAYVRKLSDKAKAGLFIPELAYTVREQRKRVLENQAAYERALNMRPEDSKPKASQPVKRQKPDNIKKLTDYLKPTGG